LLQGFDQFRPVEAFVVEQLLGIRGGLEKPLFEVFANHWCAAAFAMTIIAKNLLARQGRVAVGAEIDGRHLLVCQPVFIELLKEPLRPTVIFRVRRNDFSPPVKGITHGAELPAHTFNIGIGPLFGVDVVFDGGVFSWQTEGIKTYREEDVIALHALEAGTGIRRRHGIPVTNVKVAGGIGQHGEGVELGFVRIALRLVELISLPACLPLGLDFFGSVSWYCGWVHHVLLLFLAVSCYSFP